MAAEEALTGVPSAAKIANDYLPKSMKAYRKTKYVPSSSRAGSDDEDDEDEDMLDDSMQSQKFKSASARVSKILQEKKDGIKMLMTAEVELNKAKKTSMLTVDRNASFSQETVSAATALKQRRDSAQDVAQSVRRRFSDATALDTPMDKNDEDKTHTPEEEREMERDEEEEEEVTNKSKSGFRSFKSKLTSMTGIRFKKK
mmetsp:Transcript_35741/g.43143  ORF Transcript_35741/g.43143 Transcript_35741/m.43143 type:complete len:200 (+) Transcript_35741:2-601(+)|eukprot:CAMPEP_0197849406 /NCGR_PEP_ID=MMETSP1438-20131217/11937_1 /TAXON_ID=1461541 /ORGANISM="Pterosperma sp., Strain CCMP1384" /LENGTH=199 /DNA_ID=CAMNT_0043462071 /DNA_START=1 /DNA_END=600 /DNA_ORIENTATION=+